MAIAVVASGIFKSTTGNGFTTTSLNTTGANLIVVGFSWFGTVTPTLTDSAGNVWTPLTTRLGNTNVGSVLMYCYNPTISATHTFSVSGSGNDPNIGVIAVSGAQSAPFQVENGAGSSSAVSIATGSVTPSFSGSLLVTMLNAESITTAVAVNNGFTIVGTNAFTASKNVGASFAYLIQTVAAPTNTTWSWTGNSPCSNAVAVFLPVAPPSYTITTDSTLYKNTQTATVTATLNQVVGIDTVVTLFDSASSTISGTITIAAGQTTGTATITSLAAGVHSVTATHTGGGFSGGDGSASFPVYTVIPVTDSHLVFSPNWYSNGGGAFGANNITASSTYALTNNPGNYLKTVVNSGGSGVFLIWFDCSILTGITAGNTPVVAYSVDSGAFATVQLTTSIAQITLATGLAAGNHTIEFYFAAVDLTGTSSMGDRWTNPATGFSGVKITGVSVDTGSSLSSPVTYTYRALWFGDSSLEGAENVSVLLSVAGQDAGQSYGYVSHYGLNCEIGMVGVSTQGYQQAGYGNVPELYNPTQSLGAWPYYFSGASRTSQPLDWVICSHGLNGATTAAFVSAFITQIRATYTTQRIFILTTWCGTNDSQISLGVSQYQAANPSDARVYHISSALSSTGGAYFNAGGNAVHPNTRGDAIAAAGYVAGINAIINATGGSSGVGLSRTQQGVVVQ